MIVILHYNFLSNSIFQLLIITREGSKYRFSTNVLIPDILRKRLYQAPDCVFDMMEKNLEYNRMAPCQ